MFQFRPGTTDIFNGFLQINRLMSRIHLNDVGLSTRITGNCVPYNVVQKTAKGVISGFCELIQNGNNNTKIMESIVHRISTNSVEGLTACRINSIDGLTQIEPYY